MFQFDFKCAHMCHFCIGSLSERLTSIENKLRRNLYLILFFSKKKKKERKQNLERARMYSSSFETKSDI